MDIPAEEKEHKGRRRAITHRLSQATILLTGLADRGCAEAIFNRAEGRPRQTLDVADNRADPLADLVSSVEKLYQQKMGIAKPDKEREENSENED
jgi:hypothetical protein